MPRKPSEHRKDRNHDAVVAIAQSFGWQVVSLSSAGSGIPDILCWRHPQGYRLVEIKAGKAGKLTPAQESFRRRYSIPILYVHSEEDARTVFQVITSDAA